MDVHTQTHAGTRRHTQTHTDTQTHTHTAHVEHVMIHARPFIAGLYTLAATYVYKLSWLETTPIR